MKNKIILTLGLFLGLGSNGIFSFGIDDIPKIGDDVVNLIDTNFIEDKTNLMNKIDGIKNLGTKLKAYWTCAKNKDKSIKINNQQIACKVYMKDNLKPTLKALAPILDVGADNIFGDSTKPGFLYTLFNILSRFGISGMDDTKNIIEKIGKIFRITANLLDKLADKTEIKEDVKK